LFLVNLNETEYKSGRYKTIFEKFGIKENFSEAQKYGFNILAQNKDGSCVYLKNNSCQIHKDRPQVCRIFFCTSKSKKFEKMRQLIEKERFKNKK
jgi:Fe-S-cluster containining protein